LDRETEDYIHDENNFKIAIWCPCFGGMYDKSSLIKRSSL
jgi:hypothetical protein